MAANQGLPLPPIEEHAQALTADKVTMESFIPVYPDVDVPGIQGLITAKKEFNEMGATLREPTPKPGQYYKNQKFFTRLLMAYDNVFNISETGTGKSCSWISVAEYFKKNRSTIRHAFVLEKGPSTKIDFKNQIVCSCTSGEYDTKKNIREAKLEKTRKGNITRELKKWYSIMTYSAFANEIKDTTTDEEIIERYSGCIFLVDEAHNLHNDGISSKVELRKAYNALFRVFHLIKRSKIVISTATPMINNTGNLPYLANLILPLDHQMPPNWDYTKVTMEQLEPYFRGRITFVRNLETGAQPVYRGRLLESSTGPVTINIQVPDPNWVAPPYKQGEPQPKPPIITKEVRSQVVVWPTMMAPETKNGELWGQQARVYREILQQNSGIADVEDANEDVTEEDEVKSHFHNLERQASSFVFPDGSIGGTFPRKLQKNGEKALRSGLGKYITSEREDQYTINRDFLPWLASPEHLARLSCKFASIIHIEQKEPGCGFVFSDFLTGGGAILLGMCFEAQGFTRFEETQSVFISTNQEEIGACSSANLNRMIRSDFPKKTRYALFTSETSESKMNAMLELFNSPENMDGEYIKVIIGSPVLRDGVNVFNVRRGHLATAGWHPAGIHQALSRFLRAVSHDALLKRLRKQYEAEGKDPATAVIEVSIYKHAAFDPNGNSIDAQLYLKAEIKDLYIRRIMRMLKRIAIDCQVNYQRNVRAGDIDGSPACDYDTCAYQCFGPIKTVKLPNTNPPVYEVPPNEIDYSTYDILYADEVVDAVVIDLTQLLRERGSVTFVELKELWVATGIYREKFVYMAIEKMLSEKKQLLDPFGYGCYLQTDGSNVYTQREFPTGTSAETKGQPELAIYGKQIIGIATTPFDKVVTTHQAGSQAEIMKAIEALRDPGGKDIVEFNALLERLSLESRVQLLERSITKLLEKNPSDPLNALYNAVYTRLSSYVFYTPEPWEDIAAAAAALSTRGQGQGRKPAAGAKVKLKIDYKGAPPVGSLMPDGNPVGMVYMHTYYNSEVGLTSYAVTSTFNRVGGRIRIFNPREKLGWRDANPYETPVYSHIIQAQQDKNLENFEQFDIYGTIYSDKKFRIRDKTTEQKVGSDTRGIHRGENCATMKKPNLLVILARFGIMPDEVKSIPIPPSMTRDQMIQYLLGRNFTKDPNIFAEVTDDNLRFLVQWYVSRVSRSYMCSVIQAYFSQIVPGTNPPTSRLMVV